MEFAGPIVGKDTDNDDDIDEIVFIVANTLDGEPLNLKASVDSDRDGLLSDESPNIHSAVIAYVDSAQQVVALAWTATAIGKDDGDSLLEGSGEFEIAVDISHLSPRLNEDDKFILEIRPDTGATLVIERTTTSVIDKINDLR